MGVSKRGPARPGCSSSRRRVRGDQAAFVGDDDELRPVADVELHQQPADMGLDSCGADEERFADLLVGPAAGDECQDLGLAVGQPAERRRRWSAVGWPLDELLDERAGDGAGIGELALLLESRARSERRADTLPNCRTAELPNWQAGIGVRNTIARMVRSDLVARGPVRPQGFFSDRRGARWWWVGLPMVPFQGHRLIRTIPRFCDADGVTGRIGSGARRMRVVALGDSVTAGYAIGHHRSSIAGQLAVRLADRYGATVDWQACARTGATAGEAMDSRLVRSPARRHPRVRVDRCQ